jgi:organic radical activating enzyme
MNCSFCDTAYAIPLEGAVYGVEDAVKFINENAKGRSVGIVFTGGEPMLYEKEIYEIVAKLREGEMQLWWKDITIETNGTVPLKYELQWGRADVLFSVSPKRKEDGLSWHNKYIRIKSVYKFVDSAEFAPWLAEAIEELPENAMIYLMPEAQTREEFVERAPDTIEKCKEWGVRFSPRVQVEVWNKKRGV